MDNLEYSIEAENILKDFHEVDTIVYVEGDEDIPFWEFLIEKFSNLSINFSAVGGKPELEKFANRVYQGKLDAIVAMDLDYSSFERTLEHPKIVKTFGHSIENTLINRFTIKEVIRSIAKISRKNIPIEDCENWLTSFSKASKPLIFADIDNSISGGGIQLEADNCARFTVNDRSANLCSVKISNHLDAMRCGLSSAAINQYELLTMSKNLQLPDLLRGHFYFSGVMRFVKNYVKKFISKVTISNEALFGALLQAFEKTFESNHAHYRHYKGAVEEAI